MERKHLQLSNTGNLFNHKRIKTYIMLQHLLLLWILHVAPSAFSDMKTERVKEERRKGGKK